MWLSFLPSSRDRGGSSGDDERDDRAHRGPMGTPPDASTTALKLFLASLSMLFGATLVGYVITRTQATGWDGSHLHRLRFGLVVSTLLLAATSGSLHFGLVRIRRDDFGGLVKGMLGAVLFATLFLVNQTVGWFALMRDVGGQVKTLAVFLFYALTWLHALHVLGGYVPLFVVTRKALRRRYTAANFRGVFNCSLYWHFIDAMWVLIAIALWLG